LRSDLAARAASPASACLATAAGASAASEYIKLGTMTSCFAGFAGDTSLAYKSAIGITLVAMDGRWRKWCLFLDS
jgi:hypothetical protein